MIFFIIFISLMMMERLVEIVYARHNEKKMKRNGAIEVGADHYKWIVLLHVFFFISLTVEVIWKGGELGKYWFVFFALFLFAQLGRFWTLLTLGKYWNTKIIVLSGEKRVRKGPYRWLKHPNYLIVAIELFSLPLIFEAVFTSFLFVIGHVVLIYFIRIPLEEKALQQLLV